jgi:hypothetical protein
MKVKKKKRPPVPVLMVSLNIIMNKKIIKIIEVLAATTVS